MSNKTKVLSARVSEEEYKEIEKQSKKENISMSEKVREFILEGLTNSEKVYMPGDSYSYTESSSDGIIIFSADPLRKKELEERVKSLLRGDHIGKVS